MGDDRFDRSQTSLRVSLWTHADVVQKLQINPASEERFKAEYKVRALLGDWKQEHKLVGPND